MKDSGSRLPGKERDDTQGLKSLSLRHKIDQRAQVCGVQARKWGITPRVSEVSLGGFLVIFIPSRV